MIEIIICILLLVFVAGAYRFGMIEFGGDRDNMNKNANETNYIIEVENEREEDIYCKK